jgi:hypothetical protein
VGLGNGSHAAAPWLRATEPSAQDVQAVARAAENVPAAQALQVALPDMAL